MCVTRSVAPDSVTPWTAGSSVLGILQARVLEWGAIAAIRKTGSKSTAPVDSLRN